MIDILQNQDKILVYRFCRNPYCKDGYYELKTGNGIFLGNIDTGELSHELNIFREKGFQIKKSFI